MGGRITKAMRISVSVSSSDSKCPRTIAREGFARSPYLPFIEQVTYCPFETVIDRTATDDSQLNALLLSSAMHAHDKGAMHVNVRDETKKLSACGLKGVQTWKKK